VSVGSIKFLPGAAPRELWFFTHQAAVRALL